MRHKKGILVGVLFETRDFRLQFFIVSKPLFKVLFKKHDIFVSKINNEFLSSNITEPAHVLGKLTLERKRKGQYETGYAANINSFAKKLSRRKNRLIVAAFHLSKF